MTEKIIVKREPQRNGGNLIIYFPEEYSNHSSYKVPSFYSADNMGNYCHGDVDYQYYIECKPVGYTDVDVIKFVTDYVKYIRTLPDMEDYNIKMMKRINRW